MGIEIGLGLESIVNPEVNPIPEISLTQTDKKRFGLVFFFLKRSFSVLGREQVSSEDSWPTFQY